MFNANEGGMCVKCLVPSSSKDVFQPLLIYITIDIK